MDRKLTPKSREYIQEAVDIIRNTEDDEAAIAFLKETLEDDYPDLDLGRMDLHEAIAVLGGGKEKSYAGDRSKIEDLSKSLAEFVNKTNKTSNKPKTKKKRKRRR